MSRVAHTLVSKLVLGVAALLVVAGGGVAWHETHTQRAVTIENAQHQLSQISSQGHAGTNALTLLKEHADVTTKHYSFGDMVLSINGVTGNGPKYWTFYVNNKQADVGAGAYVTKNKDTITWKLQ